MSLPESLVEQSTLTRRQLQALQSYVRVASGEMRYREAAAGGMSRPVTVGSYFRSVQQARENVRGALATLLIGLWIGAVRIDDVRRLLDVAGGGLRELSDKETTRTTEVLRALIGKIVR